MVHTVTGSYQEGLCFTSVVCVGPHAGPVLSPACPPAPNWVWAPALHRVLPGSSASTGMLQDVLLGDMHVKQLPETGIVRYITCRTSPWPCGRKHRRAGRAGPGLPQAIPGLAYHSHKNSGCQDAPPLTINLRTYCCLVLMYRFLLDNRKPQQAAAAAESVRCAPVDLPCAQNRAPRPVPPSRHVLCLLHDMQQYNVCWLCPL